MFVEKKRTTNTYTVQETIASRPTGYGTWSPCDYDSLAMRVFFQHFLFFSFLSQSRDGTHRDAALGKDKNNMNKLQISMMSGKDMIWDQGSP
jgi:hypothetical protein